MNIIVKMSSTQLKILAGAMMDRRKNANELGNKLCEDLIYHSNTVEAQIDLREKVDQLDDLGTGPFR